MCNAVSTSLSLKAIITSYVSTFVCLFPSPRVRKPPSTPSRSTPTGDSPLSCTPKKRSPSPSASLAVQTPPLASTPRRSRHRRERGKGRRTGSSASHVTHHVTYVGEPCNAAEDEDQLYVFVPPAVLALPPYPGEGFVGENGDGEVPVADTEQQNGDVSTKVIEDGTILSMCNSHIRCVEGDVVRVYSSFFHQPCSSRLESEAHPNFVTSSSGGIPSYRG